MLYSLCKFFLRYPAEMRDENGSFGIFMFSVSLVTYRNQFADIKDLINSVLESSCSCFYIVDNANDPVLAKEISALQNDRIKYVPMSENRGFGSGHNAAIKKSMSEGCDYHMIVNPDIKFDPGTLEKIEMFMESDKEIGLVMPKTLFPDGSLQRNCKLVPAPADLIFKRFFPEFLVRFRMKRFMMCDYDHDAVLDVPYLCGCFMAFRCSVLNKTGIFDERFFMYPEDIDITRRIFSAGWRTVYYPGAEVIHEHNRESGKNMRMLWIHIVNMIRYFNKWGWIFDPERKKINKRIVELNKDKLLR